MDDPTWTWPGPGVIADDLPDDLRGWIKSELAPGERLLWAAQSVPSPRSIRGYVVGAGFGVGLVCAGAVCLAGFIGGFGRLPSSDRGVYLAIFGLLAGIVGSLVLLGTIGSWFEGQSERRRAAQRLYALTDRRAIIWRPRADPEAVEIHSIHRGEIDRVHRVEHPGGAGDVHFSRAGGLSNGSWPPLQFEMIPEVRRVEELSRRTLIGSALMPEDV